MNHPTFTLPYILSWSNAYRVIVWVTTSCCGGDAKSSGVTDDGRLVHGGLRFHVSPQQNNANESDINN